MKIRHWMVCDVTARNQKPCLMDEDTALRRGDPPRCIRHGALLFGDRTLDGMTREQARQTLEDDIFF